MNVGNVIEKSWNRAVIRSLLHERFAVTIVGDTIERLFIVDDFNNEIFPDQMISSRFE